MNKHLIFECIDKLRKLRNKIEDFDELMTIYIDELLYKKALTMDKSNKNSYYFLHYIHGCIAIMDNMIIPNSEFKEVEDN